MTIDVYSKEGCGICESAKAKLDLMGLPYNVHNVQTFVEPHEGWREDNTVDVFVAYLLNGNRVPLISIDGEYLDYPSAMRRLKSVGKRAAAAEN